VSSALTILVTGATGNQGGAVARKLLERGHGVRAFSRFAGSLPTKELAAIGAEIAVGSFDDRASIERAAEGVDAVFAMGTPYEGGMEAEVRQGTNTFEAAKAAGVGHLVYSSVASADEETGIPHFETKAELERRLGTLGVPHTIVAPAAFMENLISPWMLTGLQEGTLAVPLPPDYRYQQVGVDDLALFVAIVLEQRERFVGERIEIASDATSGTEQARLLSQLSRREIAYVEIPTTELRRSPGGEDTALMVEWFRRAGYSVDIDALRRSTPEIDWHSFEQWARARDWSVLNKKAVA
jgi:uncharacterized protein YbjT (DUF2867 family)